MPLAITTPGLGDTGGSLEWVARHDLTPRSVSQPGYSPSKVVASPDGSRLFVSARDIGPEDERRGDVLAYDTADGSLRWRNSEPSWSVQSLTVSADGDRVYAAGYRGLNWGYEREAQYGLIAYSAASGEELWRSESFTGWVQNGIEVRRWPGAPLVAAAENGSGVYLSGTGLDASGRTDTILRAFDEQTGALRWSSIFGDTDHWSEEVAHTLRVAPNGSMVFLAGQGGPIPDPDVIADGDPLTVGFDTVNGSKVWSASLASRYDGDAWSMAVSRDSAQLFVAATVFDDLRAGCHIVAYDVATGEQQWITTGKRATAGWEQPCFLEMDSQTQRLFLAMTEGYGFNDARFRVTAYDSGTGRALWDNIGEQAAGDRYATAITLSPANEQLYVAGYGNPSSSPSPLLAPLDYDYIVRAIDIRTGARLWEATYDGPDHNADYATDIAVAPDGSRVVVTGLSGADALAAATLALDPHRSCESGHNEDGPFSSPIDEHVEPASGRTQEISDTASCALASIGL